MAFMGLGLAFMAFMTFMGLGLAFMGLGLAFMAFMGLGLAFMAFMGLGLAFMAFMGLGLAFMAFVAFAPFIASAGTNWFAAANSWLLLFALLGFDAGTDGLVSILMSF